MNRKICFFPTIDSTNEYAKKMARAGAPEGTLILSEKQTHGRGRLGRVWFSPARKNIYLSVILRPQFLPSEVARITLLTGVAVAEAVKDFTKIEVRLKWPNDLVALIGDKYLKLGGILTEAGLEGNKVKYVVIGLGLNVNMNKKDFPPGLKRTATSLKEISATKTNIAHPELLQRILRKLENYYELFGQAKWKTILNKYRKYEILVGQTVSIKQDSEIISGKVKEIDTQGRLVLKVGEQIQRIVAGDVTVITKRRSGG